MVFYGDWEQGADYTRPFPYLYNNVLAPYGLSTWSGAAAAPYDDEMNAALDNAGTNTTQMTGPGASLGLEEAAVYPTSADITASKAQGGAEWNARDLLDLDYYDAMLRADMPAGAYSVQFDTATVTPTAANLHIEFVGTGRDTTAPAGAPESVVNASLHVTIQGGRTYGDAGAFLAGFLALPGMDPVAFDFDLTSYMGPSGECGISTTGVKEGTWGYYDPSQVGLINCGGGASVVQMVYTLHPPRHRWVYETPPPPTTPPGLPPLRQSPRDDNLGTASAARIWPSSSQQNSLRRLGYF